MKQNPTKTSLHQDSVVAMLRIKPFLQNNTPTSSSRRNSQKPITRSILQVGPNEINHLQSGKTFEFSKVFGEDSTNQEVFEHTILPNLEGVLRGISFCVFTYGQTSSGKTFTTKGNISKVKDVVKWLESHLGPLSSRTPVLSDKRMLRESSTPFKKDKMISPISTKNISYKERNQLLRTPRRSFERTGRLSASRHHREMFLGSKKFV